MSTCVCLCVLVLPLKPLPVWNHQYLQAVNEINSMVSNPHVWAHDGPDAELYGLAPNYGCCTANFNQGWPKFANMVFYTSNDGGVAVGLLVPASAVLADGSTIDVETTYPFNDIVTVTLTAKKAMPLYVRIPGWATNANVKVNGASKGTPKNGTMFLVQAAAGVTTVVLDVNAAVRVEQWCGAPAGWPCALSRA